VLFTDEETKQLSYLGSMLHREPDSGRRRLPENGRFVEEHGMMIKGKIVKPAGSSGSTTLPEQGFNHPKP
jgi:hypothetical protein